MKKSVWIIIITVVTICCIVGGTIYHLGVFFHEGKTVNKSLDLEAFDTIKVDANLMEITVTTGQNFCMSYECTVGLEPKYEIKNGTLTIEQRQYKRWGINNFHCSLSLTVPSQTTMDIVDVHTALGNIRLQEISASKCDVESNLGSCTLVACSFDESDVNSNMGEVVISDTNLGEAKVNSDMGEVNVDASTFVNLSATAAMGDVTVDTAQDLNQYDIDLSADLGSVKVNGHNEKTSYRQKGDDGTLEISTSMGSVRLDYTK